MLLATAEPMPNLPVKVQLERSHMLLELEERVAQVNTLKVFHEQRRALLIHTLSESATRAGHLSNQAERAAFRLEMKQWEGLEDDLLALALNSACDSIENARNAISAYEDDAKVIRYQEAQIEDAQHTLNDPDAWTDEMRPFERKGAQLNVDM